VKRYLLVLVLGLAWRGASISNASAKQRPRTMVTSVKAWDPTRGYVTVKGPLYRTRLGSYETRGGALVMDRIGLTPTIGVSLGGSRSSGVYLMRSGGAGLQRSSTGYRVR
jgi:hypothetical protein